MKRTITIAPDGTITIVEEPHVPGIIILPRETTAPASYPFGPTAVPWTIDPAPIWVVPPFGAPGTPTWVVQP